MSDSALFRRAVDLLTPNATGRTIVNLLDGAPPRATVADWYAGRTQAPQWALHVLAGKIRQRATPLNEMVAELERAPERIGKRAGAINLARYLARKRN